MHEPFVSFPTEFNTLKHHAGYIREFIEDICRVELPGALKRIGHGQIDLYIGDLGVAGIEEQTASFLACHKLQDGLAYGKWISDGGGFRRITFSDQSDWILRLGRNELRYVHLHPARKSINTYRLAANTLATAIAVLIESKAGSETKNIKFDLASINAARLSLRLSPIRSIRSGMAITKAIAILAKQR